MSAAPPPLELMAPDPPPLTPWHALNPPPLVWRVPGKLDMGVDGPKMFGLKALSWE